ncbi:MULTISPECIES: dihydrolipoamide dehydrogenase [Nonlabens]|uniref:dihydrolipoamide dehydrogenase n=1 Tax=Nonlabens TaxID=363408 RepID=UPI000CF4FC65|nr:MULTISPECIES: dihydrolipoamide dehydrogenase [Nonlabens]PQJ19079.1 dihydrolipoamide dehydrogenase [Nonlabens tegetincola]
MKKIILLVIAAVTFAACEGPQGPPGFDGLDGVNVTAQSFEITTDFFAPDYAQLIPFPNNIQTFPDDMVLTYLLWDEVPGNNGGTVDVWRLLPQVLYTDFGEFQYNYDATNGDVELFIDAPATTDLSQLAPADLQNQTFRIVILPVELAGTVDVTNYQEVMSAAQLSTNDIIVIE